MKKVVNMLNYDPTDDPGEINTMPSNTIPDQTMSLREILDRYARGIPPNGKEPIYHGDDEFVPDLKRMDLAEIQELKELVGEAVEQTTKKARKEHGEHQQRKAAEKEAEEKTLFSKLSKKFGTSNDKDNPASADK